MCYLIFFFFDPEILCSNNTYSLELVIPETLFRKQWSDDLDNDSERVCLLMDRSLF